MHTRRSTRSTSDRALKPANINKPFKSPVITKQSSKAETESKKPKSLLEEIEDSDDDISEDDKLEDDKLATELSGKLQKQPDTKSSSRSRQEIPSTPEPDPSIRLPFKEDKDEIEDDEEEAKEEVKQEKVKTEREDIFKRKLGPSKKGKFTTKKEREATEYREQKRSEREESEGMKKKEGPKLQKVGFLSSLMKNVDKYDPVKIAKESPEKPVKKDMLGLARYNHVLKKNNLDTKLLALLGNSLDSENTGLNLDLDSDRETNSDLDSDNSAASTSSKKRKLEVIDVDITPKKTKKTKKSKDTRSSKSASQIYHCPICNEEVSKQLYESYMPDLEKKIKPALKRKLHNSHKREKAHAKKAELGLPEIDWDNLNERCISYFPYLQDIMKGKVKSHFHALAVEFSKKKRHNGKSKAETIFEHGNWEKESPGYYGPRGAAIMGETIGGNKTIRRALVNLKKANDTAVVNLSEGAYIQSILVPELGTRLIMEDFDMADDEVAKGRKLMLDTIDVGLQLNPDPNDDDDEYTELNDGMDWWWKEQEEKRQQEEDTEPSMSQTSIYVDADADDD